MVGAERRASFAASMLGSPVQLKNCAVMIMIAWISDIMVFLEERMQFPMDLMFILIIGFPPLQHDPSVRLIHSNMVLEALCKAAQASEDSPFLSGYGIRIHEQKGRDEELKYGAGSKCEVLGSIWACCLDFGPYVRYYASSY